MTHISTTASTKIEAVVVAAPNTIKWMNTGADRASHIS